MKIAVVAPSGKPVTGQSEATRMLLESIRFEYILFSTDNKKGVKFFLYFPLYLWFLLKIPKLDVLYITSSRTLVGFFRDTLFIFIADFFNKPIVNHLHGSNFLSFYNGCNAFTKKLIDFVYRKIDISIVLNESFISEYSNYRNMIKIPIMNCYDPRIDKSCPVKESSSTIKVIYFSNLMYSKGIMFFLDAMARILSEGANISVCIAGDYLGDEYKTKDEIKHICEGYFQANENIVYLGLISGDEKVSFLQQADIFVLPSFYASEAQPISLIEAMASYTATIITDFKRLPEMVSNHKHQLIKSRSADDIYQKVSALINDKKMLELLKQENYRLARDKYSIERYVQEVESVLLSSQENNFKKFG